jgi:hypothetical protein
MEARNPEPSTDLEVNRPANAASAALPIAILQRAGRTAVTATKMVRATTTRVHVIGECAPFLCGHFKPRRVEHVPMHLQKSHHGSFLEGGLDNVRYGT